MTFHKILITASLTLCFTLFTDCYGNNVPYKHDALKEDAVYVDNMVTLETQTRSQDVKQHMGGQTIIKPSEPDVDNNDLELDRDGDDLEEVKVVTESMGTDTALILVRLIDELKKEMSDLKKSSENDRKELKHLKSLQESERTKYAQLDEKVRQHANRLAVNTADRTKYAQLDEKVRQHDNRLAVNTAEIIQMRQSVTEAWDKVVAMEETVSDHSALIEGIEAFQKEASKELRRFREYREDKAAKRFHQLTNMVERNQRDLATLGNQLQRSDVQVQNLSHAVMILNERNKSLSDDMRNVSLSQLEIYNSLDVMRILLNESVENISKSCEQNIQQFAEKLSELSIRHTYRQKLPNQYKEVEKNEGQKIEIMEFGSGDISDKYLSNFEEQTNIIGVNVGINAIDNVYGSGETTHDGSGESEQLPPFINVDLSNFVHKSEFIMENMQLKSMLEDFAQKHENMSVYIHQLETKLASIQLGNFMQNLQDSLINFTQNVITLDQWKVSSTQIVNSTLTNQDQILKLTNMVIENQDKVLDLKWKVSNGEIVADRQFNILRMHVIRMNNSLEDIKEAVQKLQQKQNKPTQNGFQYRPLFGNQIKFGDPDLQNQSEETEYGPNIDAIHTLMSRLDQIGLQVVFNQNRLGNLEVKILNDSLASCMKFNMDSAQDTMLASHESVIKANTQSIVLTNNLIKELDRLVQSLNHQIKLNAHRIRASDTTIESLKGLVPAMMAIKKETDNLLLQLPTDCSEYQERGYRKSGVYVIHPITAQGSSLVKCHMTQDGGWTVIQHRFDGSLDFKRRWSNYADGFGSANSEQWLGNNMVHLLTSHKNYSLRIEMVDIYNVTWLAEYDHFFISRLEDQFALHVSGYHGNATDAMGYSSGIPFSTMDNDNDGSSLNCAFFYEAGWWYKHCQTCNLNGRYDLGFLWFNSETSTYIQLRSSVMKIRARI
ncbi:protein scabrous-like [Dreissena polymorpha]|uniref:protein scabrous-like n=1 Tax=Dreissena polymorpha TaxID=45954 RepID=UPI002264D0C4|nr:protein scabrous-like [Dreissena polymorpha]